MPRCVCGFFVLFVWWDESNTFMRIAAGLQQGHSTQGSENGMGREPMEAFVTECMQVHASARVVCGFEAPV